MMKYTPAEIASPTMVKTVFTNRCHTSGWLSAVMASFSGLLIGLTPLQLATAEPFFANGETVQPTDRSPEFFTEKIYTCRNEPTPRVDKLPDYQCPKHAPNPFSKHFKYPASYKKFQNRKSSSHTGLGANDEMHFCFRVPFSGPNRFSKPAPIPEFCQGEILQLRLDMPENISNATAFEVDWGFSAKATFFCPPRGNSEQTADSLHSFDCQKEGAIRRGDTEHSYGTMYAVDDTWVLNLRLRESPGHRRLSIRVFSYQPELVNHPSCSRETELDLRIIAPERNSLHSPATSVGNGLYNVTLNKNSAYTSLVVTDHQTGKNVKVIDGSPTDGQVVITLPQGIYQVSGSTDHACGPSELDSPINLVPMYPSISTPEFIDFPLRRVHLSTQSDIPVTYYQIHPLGDISREYRTLPGQAIDLGIGGNEPDQPAPPERTYVYTAEYEGVDGTGKLLQTFVVNLEEFMPTDVVVTCNGTQTTLQWRRPRGQPDQLASYRLHVSKTSATQEKIVDIVPGSGTSQSFTYALDAPYPIYETVRFRLGAVYKNKTGDPFWWGPVATPFITLQEHTSTPPSANAKLPSPGSASVSNNNLTLVVVGSTLVGTMLIVAVTGVVTTAYLYIKKLGDDGYTSAVQCDINDSTTPLTNPVTTGKD